MSIKARAIVRRTLVLSAVALATTLQFVPVPASAAPPVQMGTGYVALGDSVPFGYREANSIPAPNYTDPTSLAGYPEDVAADLHLNVTNASCPGETSTSLITGVAPSNGCEGTAGHPQYRDVFPLHVAYSGSQLDFAVHYLRTHRHTRLVTLMVGANDAFLCQRTTTDNCLSELPSLLQTIATNVATILWQIRHDAHYVGQVVVVNYYSLNYADPLLTGEVAALNQAVDVSAAPFRVAVADGFGAFLQASATSGGDPCAAGLLTVLSGGGCGIHPDAAGQEILAGAVEDKLFTVG